VTCFIIEVLQPVDGSRRLLTTAAGIIRGSRSSSTTTPEVIVDDLAAVNAARGRSDGLRPGHRGAPADRHVVSPTSGVRDFGHYVEPHDSSRRQQPRLPGHVAAARPYRDVKGR